MNFNAFESGHLIYTVYFFLLLLFTIFRLDKTNRQNLFVFVIFIVAQILVGGLRSYVVGTDTGSYVLFFHEDEDNTFSEIFYGWRDDPVFYLFTKALSSINSHYAFILFGLQLVFWCCVSAFFYKYSNNCLLALLIFIALRYNFFAMSGLRQATAMGFIFLAALYLLNNKKLLFILLVLIASLFHKSALVFFVVVFLKRPKLNNFFIIALLAAICLALSFVLPDIDFDEDLAYTGYLQKEAKLANLYSLLITVLAFVYINVLINAKNVKFNSKLNLLYNISLFAFLISMMGLRLSIAYRIAMYFGQFMPVLMANLIGNFRNKTNIAIGTAIVLLIIYIVAGVPVGLEYKFYWEDSINF